MEEVGRWVGKGREGERKRERVTLRYGFEGLLGCLLHSMGKAVTRKTDLDTSLKSVNFADVSTRCSSYPQGEKMLQIKHAQPWQFAQNKKDSLEVAMWILNLMTELTLYK